MTDDVFGDIIDADEVEAAVRGTLELWLPAHLAHQERRRDLTTASLPRPKSWPTVSELDLEAQEQLPAIIIVSPGSKDVARGPKGARYKTWRIEVAVALGAKNEREARKLAAMYLVAVTNALVQNPTLGGRVAKLVYLGVDDHALGVTAGKQQRAIYGTAFDVIVRNGPNDRAGPTEPPEDPYNPTPLPEGPNEAEIIVTYHEDT